MADWPFISNKPGEPLDGNTVLYCGVAMMIKTTYEPADDGDWIWLQNVYREARKHRGLLTRGPHKKDDHQSHDDYVGLCAGISCTETPNIAADVVALGRSRKWVFDNSGISNSLRGWLRCWHARLPGVVQHYKICAGVELSWFDRFWWFLGTFGIRKGMSGQQMRWLRIRAYRGSAGPRYWLLDLGSKLWETRLRRRHPNLMGDVFAEYYGPDHPFTRWMQGRI